MKNPISAIIFLSIATLTYLSGCNKASQIEPDKNPVRPIAKMNFLPASYGIINNTDIRTSASVYGDSAYIKLSVNGTGSVGQIFITKQIDNETATAWINAATLYGSTFNDSTNLTLEFTASTSATYNIPASAPNFKLKIPIALKKSTTAIAETYTIWITQAGMEGDFNDPAKGLAYGIAKLSFNYNAEGLINQYTTTLGNSLDNNTASCFASVTGTKYSLAVAKDSVGGRYIAPTIDFIYNNSKPGKFAFGSIKKSAAAFDFDTAITNGLSASVKDLNRLSNVTGVAAFKGNFKAINTNKGLIDAVDAIIPLSAGNYKTSITYTSIDTATVFAFRTAAGYRGLAKITTITGDGTSTGTATLQVKVQR